MQLARTRRGFSLIELIIVVVIIGIIAAIAIPRMSRGAEGAADSALTGDLAVLRNAIDLYAAEHGGDFPELNTFANQMLGYTDYQGDISTTKTTTHIYGPYLRAIPQLPVTPEKGSTVITGTLNTVGAGWVYEESTGTITANSAADDDTGRAYNTY